ncbi:premnaspirodiene oxygenase-like isoform X2 [Prunus avium]|uniref:Premnaspirodiene oxygenase-like isoform X2 n=1 Tax=Prunus avium TaxID=42229 RepID=A0A6P5U1H2_PRUAV|nr:premnaspirodiene oxygenase-like isoform X2 [Prunus avium]
MEFQFPSGSLPTLFTIFLFIFMILKICKRHRTKNSNLKLPPGPRKLPIIGNMHQLVGSLPHHTLRDLAKIYGPLMHLQLGEVSAVVVSAPETAKEIMRTHDSIFSYRPLLLAPDIISYGGSGIAFAPYGDYWRQMRKICGSVLLNSKRVDSFQSIRDEEVSDLLKFISSNIGLPINLGEKIFSMTYGITARVAFGNKCKDQVQEELITAVREGAEATGGFEVADVFPSTKILQVISGKRPKLEKIHRKIDMILDNIVKEHKASKEEAENTGKDKANDLLGVLLNLQEHGELEVPLTMNNIKAVLLDIFTAGSETSSSTVEWAMSEMLNTPRVMKKAQAEVRQVFRTKGNVEETGLQELKFLKAVIKETLRVHPPIPLLLPKECSESCEIDGYGIPVKTKVIVNAWAIGRDSKKEDMSGHNICYTKY